MNECELIWEGWNRVERELAHHDMLIFGSGLVKKVGKAEMHIPIVEWSDWPLETPIQ